MEQVITSQIRLTLGRKGQGKSYMLGKDMEGRLKKPFVFVDYGEEHLDFCKAHPNAWLFPIKDFMLGCIDWPDLLTKYHGIIVYPDMISFDEFTEEVDKLMHAILKAGGRTVVIEEVQELASQLRGIMPGFKRLVNQGRKKKIDILAASLQPSQVSKILIAQCDDFILFNIHETHALKYLSLCGMPSEMLPDLPKFEAIYYCPQTGETRRVRAGKRRIKHRG